MRAILLSSLICIGGLIASAGEITVTMNSIDQAGIGSDTGTITVTDSQHGALFTPNLAGLTHGLHGFHLHENPDCGPAEKDGKVVPGLAAGGHYDPEGTGAHLGPYTEGHLGDLPALYVDDGGNAEIPVLAPRVKVSDLSGRSLVIHAGADNYSDDPMPLGGGGARVACGVIDK